jgi:hypothetical protein
MSTIKHPSQYSDEELLRLLRIERTKVTRQLIAAKERLRHLVSTIEGLETRLQNIDSSEQYLIDKTPERLWRGRSPDVPA